MVLEIVSFSSFTSFNPYSHLAVFYNRFQGLFILTSSPKAFCRFQALSSLCDCKAVENKLKLQV